MTRKMTREEARAWAARWRAVNRAERAEMAGTPMATRWKQIVALNQSIGLFRWTPWHDEQAREIRDRWARIREAWRDRHR